MPAKRRPRQRQPEILSRNIVVGSTSFSVDLYVDKRRGSPPTAAGHSYLRLKGVADEPIKDTREVQVQLSPVEEVWLGNTEPPCIGAIIQTRPHVTAVISLARADFDRAWSMAASDRLRFAYLAFTRPLRGTALVVSVRLSSERDEE